MMLMSSFFFNDTATTEIYTLSLHDALPIFTGADLANLVNEAALLAARNGRKEIGHAELEEGIMRVVAGDRKSTRLNSSHANISYAVFCLKKKKVCRKQRTIQQVS